MYNLPRYIFAEHGCIFVLYKFQKLSLRFRGRQLQFNELGNSLSENRAYVHVTQNFVGHVLGTSKEKLSSCPVSTNVDPSRLVAVPFPLGITLFSLSSVLFFFCNYCSFWLSRKHVSWNPAHKNLEARAKLHGRRAGLQSSCPPVRFRCLLAAHTTPQLTQFQRISSSRSTAAQKNNVIQTIVEYAGARNTGQNLP